MKLNSLLIPLARIDLSADAFTRWLTNPKTWDTIGPYIAAALTLIIGILIARLMRNAISQLVRKSGSDHNALIAGKATFYGIILLTIVIVLGELGIEIKGLLAAAGILTVAISFAAQTSVSNVISGIFLLFDRPFSINDTIKVDMTLGTVVSIGLLSSKVRTFDNLIVRIPNEALLKSTITNYSMHNVRRVEIPVQISFEADVDALRDLILELIEANALVLNQPAPVVLTDRLFDQGIELNVRGWVITQDYVRARSELVDIILDALRAHDLPQPTMRRIIRLES